jgi:hypothetical protein
METLTAKLGDILEKLGQAFLIAGYLPAALFVLAHQIFLLPRWQGQPIALLRTTPPGGGAMQAEWVYLVDQAVTLLLLPLLLGVLLMALNTIIIKLYEGAYGWQRRLVLRPWRRRNQRQAEALYGEMVSLKQDYTDVLYELSALPPGADRTPLEQKRVSIALALQASWDKVLKERPQPQGGISTHAPAQLLPRRPDMVKPTALGNAFGVIEEYPYERYGMDGVLFWPRLRPLLDEPQATTLINTKMVLDLLLNLSLLALVFGAEAVSIGVWSRLDWTLIGSGIGAWALAYVCYRGAVSAVHSLGDTIALCFDLYRGKLWERFGFPPPKSLEEEQETWLRLGQFLRLGEGFYYPQVVEEKRDET